MKYKQCSLLGTDSVSGNLSYCDDNQQNPNGFGVRDRMFSLLSNSVSCPSEQIFLLGKCLNLFSPKDTHSIQNV